MIGGGGGGGGSSKRRHSTQSLSLLYRPSKPDIDLIRDVRRGSTCAGGTASGGGSEAGLPTPSFLSLRRHSEVVTPTPSPSPGRQVRLSIDSGRVVQEFHFVKRGFFKSADQIYNKVFGGGGGSGSSSNNATTDAYHAHYGGGQQQQQRNRSKSFNALGGSSLLQQTSPSPAASGTTGTGTGDFSSLGQAIENHLRNQLRRATFSNITATDGGVGTGSSAAASASLGAPIQRPRSASTCVSFPTIIVTASSSGDAHHPSQPTASLVRTEYENKTQVILEDESPTNNGSSAAAGGGFGGTGGMLSLCGLVRELLHRTLSVGVGFIRGGGGQQQQPATRGGGGGGASSSSSSNKRFFF